MTRNQRITTLLTALTVGVFAVAGAQAQVMGPVNPDDYKQTAPPSPVTDKVKSGFKKMFGKQNNAEEDAEEESTAESLQKPPAQAQSAPQRPARPPLISAPPEPAAKIEEPEIDQDNPPIVKVRLVDPNNPLGLADATNRLDNVEKMITQRRVDEAKSSLPPLRQWLIDSTEAHINLYKTLNKLPSARAQAELERQLALEFALLRDRSIFLAGKINVAEKDYKKAVKELIEVVKSQPKSRMGIEAYGILQDIGFTEKIHLAD